MKLSNILFASLLGMGLLFIVSCDKEPELTDCEKTTYDAKVQAIMDKGCNLANCHDGASGSERKPLTTFTEVSNLGGGVMARAITAKDMPPAMAISGGYVAALTADEIEVLKCWLDNGKKEN